MRSRADAGGRPQLQRRVPAAQLTVVAARLACRAGSGSTPSAVNLHADLPPPSAGSAYCNGFDGARFTGSGRVEGNVATGVDEEGKTTVECLTPCAGGTNPACAGSQPAPETTPTQPAPEPVTTTEPAPEPVTTTQPAPDAGYVCLPGGDLMGDEISITTADSQAACEAACSSTDGAAAQKRAAEAVLVVLKARHAARWCSAARRWCAQRCPPGCSPAPAGCTFYVFLTDGTCVLKNNLLTGGKGSNTVDAGTFEAACVRSGVVSPSGGQWACLAAFDFQGSEVADM